MIIGAHAMIFSANAEADRAFLRDVLKLASVDAGGGFQIYGLPPSEIAIHEADQNDTHQIFFMCENVERLVQLLSGMGVACAPIEDRGWGVATTVTLPGGGNLGVYEPRHQRPKPVGLPKPKAARSAAKAKPKAKAKAKAIAKTATKPKARKTKAKAAPKKPARKPAARRSAVKSRRR